MDRMLIISADSHISPPSEAVEEYLDPSYREWLNAYQAEAKERDEKWSFLKFNDSQLAVLDPEGLVRSGGDLGCELDRRLLEMDREGIAAERIVAANLNAPPPFFHSSNRAYPVDVQMAGLRMYHRWVADFMAASGGRLFGVAYPGPCLDMEATLDELGWAAEHGFNSATLPGEVTGEAYASLPPLGSDYFEPLWSACIDLGMTLSIHAGHGGAQGSFHAYLEFARSFVGEAASDEELQSAIKSGIIPGSALGPTTIPQQFWWQLMAGGVFDRHPSLKLVFTEVRADWVPQTIAFLDARFAEGDTPLTRPPSEYWAENCMTVASSIKRSEVRLRHQIGVDHMMFGRDYPHREGTWPNTLDWLRDAIGGMPEEEARLLLGENAVNCFGLDRVRLQAIADRIGLSPSDIFEATQPVDDSLLVNFDRRSGYNRSHEEIDREALRRDLDKIVA
jgi:predicted TIM-barrel fold metal-dependent hydrolase